MDPIWVWCESFEFQSDMSSVTKKKIEMTVKKLVKTWMKDLPLMVKIKKLLTMGNL